MANKWVWAELVIKWVVMGLLVWLGEGDWVVVLVRLHIIKGINVQSLVTCNLTTRLPV